MEDRRLAGLSAEKRQRQNLKRKMRNRAARSGVKTAQRKFQLAVKGNNLEDAQKAYGEAERLIDRVSRKGVFHKNTAARTKSRMRKKLNSLKVQS